MGSPKLRTLTNGGALQFCPEQPGGQLALGAYRQQKEGFSCCEYLATFAHLESAIVSRLPAREGLLLDNTVVREVKVPPRRCASINLVMKHRLSFQDATTLKEGGFGVSKKVPFPGSRINMRRCKGLLDNELQLHFGPDSRAQEGAVL